MGAADDTNLRHVLYEGRCEDPDCEIHNIDVAIEERVISGTNLAYFYAGAQTIRDMFLHATDVGVREDLIEDDEDRLDACLGVIRKQIVQTKGA